MHLCMYLLLTLFLQCKIDFQRLFGLEERRAVLTVGHEIWHHAHQHSSTIQHQIPHQLWETTHSCHFCLNIHTPAKQNMVLFTWKTVVWVMFLSCGWVWPTSMWNRHIRSFYELDVHDMKHVTCCSHNPLLSCITVLETISRYHRSRLLFVRS